MHSAGAGPVVFGSQSAPSISLEEGDRIKEENARKRVADHLVLLVGGALFVVGLCTAYFSVNLRDGESMKILSTVVYNSITATILALLPRNVASETRHRYGAIRIFCCELSRTLALFFGVCGASLLTLQCDNEMGLAFGTVAAFLAFSFCRLDDGRKLPCWRASNYPDKGCYVGFWVLLSLVIGILMQQRITSTSQTARGYIVILPVASNILDASPIMFDKKATKMLQRAIFAITLGVSLAVAYVVVMSTRQDSDCMSTQYILGFLLCWIGSSAIPFLLALSNNGYFSACAPLRVTPVPATPGTELPAELSRRAFSPFQRAGKWLRLWIVPSDLLY